MTHKLWHEIKEVSDFKSPPFLDPMFFTITLSEMVFPCFHGEWGYVYGKFLKVTMSLYRSSFVPIFFGSPLKFISKMSYDCKSYEDLQ